MLQRLPMPDPGERQLRDGPYGLPPAVVDLDYGVAQGPAAPDLLRAWDCLLRHRLLVGLFLLAGLLAGLAIYALQTPIYEASTRIEISVPAARVVQDLEVVSEVADLRAFQTAIEKLKSTAVLGRVAKALQLDDRAAISFSPISDAETASADSRLRSAIARIRAGLTIALIRNTSILTIAYRDPDPVMAQAIVNAIAQSYIEQRAAETGETTAAARRFIEGQVQEVKARLHVSEQRLVQYAKEHRITVAGEDGSLIDQNIRAINAALAAAMGERLAAESQVAQIDAGAGSELKEVLANPAGLEIRARLVELRAEYQQKLRTFKPDFPDMRMLAAQIREFDSQLASLNEAVVGSMRRALAEARIKESQIRAKLGELEIEQAAYQDRSIHYTILQREVDSNRAQYESLVGKLNEVGVGAELRMQAANVLDHAERPGGPVEPSLSRTVLTCLALAALIAAAAVYLLERLNNSFRSPGQLEAELGLPVLSVLPFTAADRMEAELADGRSGLSEAYRSLRTSLQFAAVNGAPRILLVTSAEPGEGKTTSAHQVAASFAALGQRVLLVDADLRRPSVHRQLGLPNTHGLSNILTNTVTREAFPGLFHAVAPNFMALTAGPIAPNPVDLLSSGRMGMLFAAFQRRYDLVVIDGPPVIGLADAPILSRLADGTLMVVSARQVMRKAAALALRRLRAAGGNVLGAAMTKFHFDEAGAASAYGAMKYDYYGYGERMRLADFDPPPRKGLWRALAASPVGTFLRRRLEAA